MDEEMRVARDYLVSALREQDQPHGWLMRLVAEVIREAGIPLDLDRFSAEAALCQTIVKWISPDALGEK